MPSNISTPLNFPKVNPIELELPYRGLFNFDDSNTYNTLPNFKDKQFFKKSIKDSEIMKRQYSDLTLVSPSLINDDTSNSNSDRSSCSGT